MKRVKLLFLGAAMVSTIIFSVYFVAIYLLRDLDGPEITSGTDILQVSIHDTEAALCKELTATDLNDGDVSDSLIVESINMMEDSICQVIYAASDKSNNVSKFKGMIQYTDYHSPHFSIDQKLRFPLDTSDQSILEHITAEDCIDGDLSSFVKLKPLDNSKHDTEGIYEYHLIVNNSINDKIELPLSIEFYTDKYETRLYYPNIVLSNYIAYVKAGEEFLPKTYLDHLELGNKYYIFSASTGNKLVDSNYHDEYQTRMPDGVNIDGTIHLSTIRVDSDVDTQVPGIYHVTFSCNSTDNYIGSTQMTVVVEP